MTSDKSYAIEARIDTQVTQGWSIPYEAIKSSDEGRSSTTLANDGELQFFVPAGHYSIEMSLGYHGGAGTSEGDFKFDWNIPTGYLRASSMLRLASDGGALHYMSYIAATPTTAWTNGVSNDYWFAISGTLDTTADGTLYFRWAKGQSSDTNTTLLQYSKMTAARRI